MTSATRELRRLGGGIVCTHCGQHMSPGHSRFVHGFEHPKVSRLGRLVAERQQVLRRIEHTSRHMPSMEKRYDFLTERIEKLEREL